MERTIKTGVVNYIKTPNKGVSNPGEPDRINPCFQPQFPLPSYG